MNDFAGISAVRKVIRCLMSEECSKTHPAWRSVVGQRVSAQHPCRCWRQEAPRFASPEHGHDFDPPLEPILDLRALDLPRLRWQQIQSAADLARWRSDRGCRACRGLLSA